MDLIEYSLLCSLLDTQSYPTGQHLVAGATKIPCAYPILMLRDTVITFNIDPSIVGSDTVKKHQNKQYYFGVIHNSFHNFSLNIKGFKVELLEIVLR